MVVAALARNMSCFPCAVWGCGVSGFPVLPGGHGLPAWILPRQAGLILSSLVQLQLSSLLSSCVKIQTLLSVPTPAFSPGPRLRYGLGKRAFIHLSFSAGDISFFFSSWKYFFFFSFSDRRNLDLSDRPLKSSSVYGNACFHNTCFA